MKQLDVFLLAVFAFTVVPSFAQLSFDSYNIEKEEHPLRNYIYIDFNFKK